MSAELLISADSHVVEDPQLWKKRLPGAVARAVGAA